MPRTGETYKKLAPGIYAVYDGRRKVAMRAQVRVHGVLHNSPRFGPDTNKSVLQAWREDQRAEGRKSPPPAPVVEDGFTADATRYLTAVSAMSSYSDRERDIEAWKTLFGVTPRSQITRQQIATALATWRKTLAASTVNHRRTALMHLYRVLDGPDAANPVKGIPKFHEPEPEPRGLPYDTISRIFAAMDDTVTRARLQVIAYVGLPHSTIARLQPRDIDWKQGLLVRPGRRKGAGTRRQTVPLTKDGIAALKALAAFEGIGVPFSRSSLHSSFRRACDSVQKATGIDLAGVRPYDLRHSYGTEVYRLTGDERAVQQLLGHAKIDTTHRYTLGGVDARLRAATDAFNAKKSPTKVSTRRKPKQKAT